MSKEKKEYIYTCNEYREEMVLISLHKRLMQHGLSQEEKEHIEQEIEKIEKKMGL